MDSEVVQRLDQIADLLRRRLELEERRDDERTVDRRQALENMKEFKLNFPKIEMPELESHNDFTKKLEEAAEIDRDDRRAFQSALLEEIRRHNTLLEQLLAEK